MSTDLPTADIRANETTVPMLPCVSSEETTAFYRALGFDIKYEMHKPYLYLSFAMSGFQPDYKKAPQGIDPADEDAGGCLVFVDDVASYHAAFTAAMRESYGKVLAKGLPRITRYRPGASRFTLPPGTASSSSSATSPRTWSTEVTRACRPCGAPWTTPASTGSSRTTTRPRSGW
jgi:hypothetical protein